MTSTFAEVSRHALKGGTALLLAHLMLGVAPALAQTWDGGTNTNWTIGTNWDGDVAPGVGDTATIDGQGGGNQPRLFGGTNVTIDALNHSAGTLTINSGASLAVTTAYALSGNAQLFLNGGGSLTGDLSVADTGTATLQGTLTGNLAITGGTVAVAGAVTGATTISGGGLGLFTGSDLSDTQTLTVNAGFINQLTNETVGALAGTGGTITIFTGQTLTTGGSNADTAFAGVIGGAGSFVKTGSGTLTLTGALTYTGTTTINAGTLEIAGTGSLGATNVTNNSGFRFAGTASAGTSTITNNSFLFFNNTSNAGTATITNATGGQLAFSDNSSANAANITNNDAMTVQGGSTLANATVLNNFGLNFLGTATAGNATVTTSATGSTNFVANSVGGTARFILEAGGNLGIFNRAGGVTIGSLEGTGTVFVGRETLSVGTRNTNTTFGGVIDDFGLAGGLTKVGTGTLTLTGASTYTGATQVDAGTLIVNGSLASAVTVGAAGTFGGSGTIPGLTVNGTVSPGNSPGTLTVNGNVVFGAGSVYVAEVQGAQADRINATGTATIDAASTLRLVPLGGAYLFNTPYTLLRAQGGRTGTFGTVNTQGSFGAGVTTAVTYTGTDVNLTLAPAPLGPVLAPFGLATPRNPAAVAAGFDAALASGANLDAFFPLYNQSAANLPGALNTVSGEVHTAASAMGFDVQGRFLATMLDPFAMGRRGNAASGTPAFYAAEQYAKAPGPLGRMGRTSLDVPMPDPRYSVWGSVFGATGQVDGNAATGAARRDTDHAGIAVGADYRFNPHAAIGFAVSGAKANASLANGLGSAEADAFQAGLYGMARAGDLSFGLSAAYSWLDVEARRSVPVLGFQPLSGEYDAHGFGIRAEAAWAAFRTAGVTFSPTAAIQAQSIRTDGFRETAAAGAGAGAAALAVDGRTANAARTELGLRLDADFRAGTTDITAFASVAWAHYFERDITMSASIIALPAAAFTVEGARRDRDAALIGLGLDVKLTPMVSLTARADGAFSANATELGGSAALRVRF